MQEVFKGNLDNFIKSSSEINYSLSRLEKSLNSHSVIQDEVSILSELSLKYEDSLTKGNSDKLIKLNEVKTTLLNVKYNICDLLEDLNESKENFENLYKQINSLIYSGELLLDKCDSDLNILIQRKGISVSDSDFINMKYILDQRKILLSSSLLSLNTQRMQLDTFKELIFNPRNKLMFLIDKYIPLIVLQINTSKVLIKYELLEDLSGLKLISLDLKDIADLSRGTSELQGDSEKVQFTMIKNQCNSLKSTLENFIESCKDKDFIGRDIVIKDTERLIKDINKLNKGETNND